MAHRRELLLLVELLLIDTWIVELLDELVDFDDRLEDVDDEDVLRVLNELLLDEDLLDELVETVCVLDELLDVEDHDDSDTEDPEDELDELRENWAVELDDVDDDDHSSCEHSQSWIPVMGTGLGRTGRPGFAAPVQTLAALHKPVAPLLSRTSTRRPTPKGTPVSTKRFVDAANV